MTLDPEGELELRRLRLLHEYSSEVMTLLDRDGTVIYRSSSRARPLGYPDGLVGKVALDIIHPEDRQRVADGLRSIRAEPGASTTQILRARHADGSWRWLWATATNLFDEPSVGALVISYRDITEQKRAERAAESAQKLASLGTLAAGVGHEINNPLTALMLTLQSAARIADGCSGELSQELRESLAHAKDAAERIATIVRDLRMLVGEESVSTTSAVSVERVLENALLRTASLLSRHAEVVRQYQPVSMVEATEARLEQVFVNVLTNAAHAMPRGRSGNSLKLRIAPGAADVVRVEVEDNGCGIPEDHLDQVFDPFFSTKRHQGGTGLGLHIARRSIASMGGSMSVSSQLGVGTTFSVVLAASK